MVNHEHKLFSMKVIIYFQEIHVTMKDDICEKDRIIIMKNNYNTIYLFH